MNFYQQDIFEWNINWYITNFQIRKECIIVGNPRLVSLRSETDCGFLTMGMHTHISQFDLCVCIYIYKVD